MTSNLAVSRTPWLRRAFRASRLGWRCGPRRADPRHRARVELAKSINPYNDVDDHQQRTADVQIPPDAIISPAAEQAV